MSRGERQGGDAGLSRSRAARRGCALGVVVFLGAFLDAVPGKAPNVGEPVHRHFIAHHDPADAPWSPPAAEPPGRKGFAGDARLHLPGGKPLGRMAPQRSSAFGTGYGTFEPTLGVLDSGAVFFYPAYQTYPTLDLPGVARSRDGGESWELLFPTAPHLDSGDPFVHVDPETGTVIVADLYGAYGGYSCFRVSRSDDEGVTWFHNPRVCPGTNSTDHQSVAVGPPVKSTTSGYEKVIYMCWWDVASGRLDCSRSIDGGLTFTMGEEPAFSRNLPVGDSRGCNGGSGHLVVGRDGTLYLPKACFPSGLPSLAVSRDEGDSWQRYQVSDIPSAVGNNGPSHEGAVAVDSAGNLFYLWIAQNRRPLLAVSRDDGRTWSNAVDVAAPGVDEANLPTIAAGKKGRIAVAYVGTTNSPYASCAARPLACAPVEERYAHTTWNGYIGVSTNALDASPVFASASVNHPSDPMVRGTCGPARCPRVLDFIDVVIGPDGYPWASFSDVCVEECASGGENNSYMGILGRLEGGPRLR